MFTVVVAKALMVTNLESYASEYQKLKTAILAVEDRREAAAAAVPKVLLEQETGKPKRALSAGVPKRTALTNEPKRLNSLRRTGAAMSGDE